MGVCSEMENSKAEKTQFVMSFENLGAAQKYSNVMLISNLQEMERALSELQVLQLAAPHLQLVDFPLQLVQQLLSSPLHSLLLLLDLFDELGLLFLNGSYQHGADLRTALDLSRCDILLIKINVNTVNK